MASYSQVAHQMVNDVAALSVISATAFLRQNTPLKHYRHNTVKVEGAYLYIRATLSVRDNDRVLVRIRHLSKALRYSPRMAGKGP